MVEFLGPYQHLFTLTLSEEKAFENVRISPNSGAYFSLL